MAQLSQLFLRFLVSHVSTSYKFQLLKY